MLVGPHTPRYCLDTRKRAGVRNMPNEFWIVMGLLALGAILLLGRMLKLFRQSREAEKRIDYSKIRKFEDEDEW